MTILTLEYWSVDVMLPTEAVDPDPLKTNVNPTLLSPGLTFALTFLEPLKKVPSRVRVVYAVPLIDADSVALFIIEPTGIVEKLKYFVCVDVEGPEVTLFVPVIASKITVQELCCWKSAMVTVLLAIPSRPYPFDSEAVTVVNLPFAANGHPVNKADFVDVELIVRYPRHFHIVVPEGQRVRSEGSKELGAV